MTQVTGKIQVDCTFRGMDASPASREYAEKRATKLEKHVHHVSDCKFVFFKEREDFVAQLHVISGDLDARAEARAETLYAAIDEVTDKILQQTRKHKEKREH